MLVENYKSLWTSPTPMTYGRYTRIANGLIDAQVNPCLPPTARNSMNSRSFYSIKKRTVHQYPYLNKKYFDSLPLTYMKEITSVLDKRNYSGRSLDKPT
jgi:TRAP-type C4-dicarboxylate transport system substrate-binding protein